MGKLGRLWKWLANPHNRATVALIGGGVATLVGGAWTLYLHFSKPLTPEIKQTISGVQISGGVTAARDVIIQNKDDNSNKILSTLDTISKSFDTLQKQGGIISNPSTPQEYYHNARIQELHGDFASARKSYQAYLTFNLDFIDPHFSYQNMLKVQEGKEATKEIYNYMLSKSDNLALRFTNILLLNRELRIIALHKFIQENPNFAPAYYQLSREYSKEKLGVQTLAEKRLEKSYLERFTELDSRGNLIKYFLDKKLAEQWQEEAKKRLKELESITDAILKSPVTLSGQLGNNGLDINIHIADDVKEIYYRLDTESPFKSTGSAAFKNPQTGLPMPRDSITIRHGFHWGKNVVFIKYIDRKGIENGPYEVTFDAIENNVDFVKSIMNMTEWVVFRKNKDGIVVDFINPLCWRSGIKDILYSIDNDILNNKVNFIKFDPKIHNGNPGIGNDDVAYFTIPSNAKYICVQLIYSNNSKSAIKKYYIDGKIVE